MANPQRGEVDLMTDQGARTMRLSLGALAELEAELGADGLVGIAERFEGCAFTSRDLIALLAAGLRGAGEDITQRDVEPVFRRWRCWRRISGGASAGLDVQGRLMKPADSFDWDLLMRFGLGVLGLGPTEFWKMTPTEFEAAVKGRLGQSSDAAPFSRDRLNTLLQRYPDGETKS